MPLAALETDSEQQLEWRRCFRSRILALRHHAHPVWFDGVRALGLGGELPDLDELRQRLEALVGWSIAEVDGNLDGLTVNSLLRDRCLPVATRTRDGRASDLVHDVLGHLPWLVSPTYRRFLAAFGEAWLDLLPNDQAAQRLSHAFDWTVEYGLVAARAGVRACGARLISTAGLLPRALAGQAGHLRFDAATVIAAGPVIPGRYFVLPGLDALEGALEQLVRYAVAGTEG